MEDEGDRPQRILLFTPVKEKKPGCAGVGGKKGKAAFWSVRKGKEAAPFAFFFFDSALSTYKRRKLAAQGDFAVRLNIPPPSLFPLPGPRGFGWRVATCYNS